MATEVVSSDDAKNRQSFNMAAPADGSSPDLGPSFLLKVQKFPKHDTVKLSKGNFFLWKQQVMLIFEGYNLNEFVLGTVAIPPQYVVDNNGVLTSNPEFLFHKKQDKLLTSWLLSTICDYILIHLSSSKTSCEVWSTVLRRFA
ncbi:hypothetical protein PVK06_018976 [Gossypium arboreum]|uniref:Retrotransposon Copia-like N-terminal domain-containing protein n=1 Tax=Gossypium arboreum TaxID=29729 RepID=A0ABR0PIL9_GOSAR|nr:hypothetical protein PVK06_018976 [Gossypium arboreum]